MKLKEYPKP